MTAVSRNELRSYKNIEVAAQAVLDARALHANASLADYMTRSPCRLTCSKPIRH